jgi:hypothetical protein
VCSSDLGGKEISHNKYRRNNMELNKQFTITYYSNKDKKHITRRGKWTDKCRYWTSKIGDSLITYFDMDADNYRTAKGSWKVRL